MTRGSAHINDGRQAGEVVCGGNCRRFRSMDADHRLAEHGRLLRMLSQPVEDGHAQRFLKSAFSGLNRIQQLPKAARHPVARHGQDCGTRRAWCAGLERLTEWRQSEAMRRVLGQDSEVRERPHEAVEGGCMSPGWPGKFVGTLRPLREVVSQTKFGCNVNNVRHPVCHVPSGPVAREAALLEFRRDYSRAYVSDAAFQPPVWRAQVSRTTSAGFLSSRIADEGAMPQVSGVRPFNECDLADQLRFDPAALFHFLCG